MVVYDYFGQEEPVQVNDVMDTGMYPISFNGSKLSSGIYFRSENIVCK